MQIERRHLEIAEMLRKLLELDAANRAEAAALVRLSVDDESALASLPDAAAGPASGRPVDGSGPAAATTSSGGGGDGSEAARAGAKRRNPFSRAVSAIRRKFARPQQSAAVPVAA